MDDVPAPHRAGGPRRYVSAEVTEEWGDDWGRDSDRLLATFQIRLDDGDDGELDDPDDWDDEDRDDEWDEARATEAAAAREAELEADPLRGLPIDEAIALAQTLADRVTVYFDGNQPWDASDPPRPNHALRWPPPDLDLRPRWHYEPATSERHAAWWVRFTFDAVGLTPSIAREAAASLPTVLEVRLARNLTRKERRRTGAGLTDRRGNVSVECLVLSTPEESVLECRSLIKALKARLPRPDVPARIRIQQWYDRLLRRSDRSYGYWGPAIGVSPQVLGPGEPPEPT